MGVPHNFSVLNKKIKRLLWIQSDYPIYNIRISNSTIPLGTSDISENGASSVPDPGGPAPPDEQDPGKVHASSIPNETDVPRQNNNYTSFEEGTGVQLDSSAPDNGSTTARNDRVLAILLLTLIYILNS